MQIRDSNLETSLGRAAATFVVATLVLRLAAAAAWACDPVPMAKLDILHSQPEALARESPRPEDAAAGLRRVQDAFESLVERVGRATVTIQVRHGPGDGTKDGDDAADAAVDTGSGVIIRNDGTILTSQHVVEQAGTILVILHDGRRFRARIVAADARSDLAVIRIHADGVVAAELGDARTLRRGHFVLALGNPLGLSIDGQVAVSEGVVAAMGRPLPEALGVEQDRYYGDMIQTSIRVGPGSSGGPLIDLDGRVVGIMTAMGWRGGASGFGFAVPINAHTKAITERLIEGRPIEYGYLGLEVRTLEPADAKASGVAAGRGVYVDFVLENGPGERAGLQRGDIIVTVDGTPVNSPDRFVQLVGAAGPDRRVQIGFVRGVAPRTVDVVLARRTPTSRQERASRAVAFRGAVLEEIGAAQRAAVNLPSQALLVTMVSEASPAARAGLAPGDVIVRVNGDAPRADAEAQLAGLRDDVLLGLADGGSVLVRGQ